MCDVFPGLRYQDPHGAVEWLCSAFGFERHAVHENESGDVVHAELRHGESVIMLGPSRDDAFGPRVGQGWVYVVLAEPDVHYRRAVDAGAEIVMELTDTDYGSRDYSARDPEGNLWSFGTYRPELPA